MPDMSQPKTKVCLSCQKEFSDSPEICPHDGSPVVDRDDPRLSQSSMIGKVFADKYEILGVLGEGGMSIVYKARHRYMDRVVAVKVLHDHLVSDKNAIARFEHESKAASSLSHLNIVSVHDFGMTRQDQAYFVMDCLEGPSLADLLEQKGRLAVSEALPIFLQTCDGLEHAHKKRVVHRDLKPSNLVLMKNEDGSTVVKIVDFGIAKLLPIDGQQQQRLTQTGEIFGSPLYMSPEQCQGNSLDQRSDIYSFGCLMYETISGVPPHIGESFVDTVVKHTTETPSPFSQAVPDLQIPAAVEACIMKCLAKNPDDRYQSAHELRKNLLEAALAAGIKGVRAGAVTATSMQDILAHTFQRIKPGSKEDKRKKLKAKKTAVLLSATLVSLLLLAGALGAILVWAPEDNIPNFRRIRWQWHQSMAQDAIKKQDYEDARHQLLEAAELARPFQDRHARLLETLYLLADTYGKSGMFAQQENINNEIDNIALQLALDDQKTCLRKMNELLASTGSLEYKQKEAEIGSEKVLLCAKKLFAQSLDQECEKLLRQAIGVFSTLKLEKHEKMASLKLMLAESLNYQQRLTEVRPLLVDALEVRQQIATARPADRRASNLKAKALLRLGQFDRDQSNHELAKKELEDGLKLAEAEGMYDKELLVEALSSYADLFRQMGDKQKAAEYQRKADDLSVNLPRHAKELRRKPKHDAKRNSEVQ